MSDDLIKRSDVIKFLNDYLDDCYRVSRRKYEKTMLDAISMDFEAVITDIPAVETKQGGWIPCSEGKPKCEQEVLVCTEKKLLGENAYIDSIITPAIYEDGTMPEDESMWSWNDMDFDEWDDENDCGIIPEGWWENRHFNRDDDYNNPIDRKVVAWMPLPEPYAGDN